MAKIYSLIKNGIRKDFTEAGLKDYLAKGGPGSGRKPEGGLRANAKFGDEVEFETGGERLRGTIQGQNEKGELKIVTNSGTIHFRNKAELTSPEGGYRQRGE